ncbi:hypothetical protein DFH29DRAFT_569368 [Suillus ampliporus]|nr:hypothetical protein DFH29DRAFT_569368 [Suillus ampliporus]
MYSQRSRSTLTIPPPTSSSSIGHAPDQDSMRSTLQSCLECLDKHNDRIICVYREILEIRTRITELLASCQPEVAVGDSVWNDSVDFQVIVDEGLQAIAPVACDELDAISLSLTLPELFLLPQPPVLHGQLSDQEYRPLESVGVTGSLSEGADSLVGQVSQEIVHWGSSSFVGHQLGAHPFLPQPTFSEGQALSDTSVRRNQQPPLPVVQGNQEKVKCTWPGCSKFVTKDNRTRHVNETHLRKVKAVCAGCGKGFARPYMKKDLTRPNFTAPFLDLLRGSYARHEYLSKSNRTTVMVVACSPLTSFATSREAGSSIEQGKL